LSEIKFKVLDSIKDSHEWNDIIHNNLKINEIFFRYEYINLFTCQNTDKKKEILGNLFVAYNDKGNFWINPFLKSRINNYDDITCNNFFEIQTPYGYGGPYSNTRDLNFISDSQDVYFKWCVENKIVVEFVRFNPILDNKFFFNKIDKIHFERNSRYFDLKLMNKDLTNFSSKVRNKIKQAKKADIEIDFNLNKFNFNQFKDYYLNFIKSIKANKFYLFDINYFEKLYELTNKLGFLVIARHKKNFLGGSIFIGYKKNINYYLTVIPEKKLFPGINNLILINGYLLSKEKGFEFCNLGGGISNSGDSLYDFKKSMSNAEFGFYIGYKIYNHILYQQIKKDYILRYPIASQKNSSKILCYNFYD
jgi:hypothetical protein